MGNLAKAMLPVAVVAGAILLALSGSVGTAADFESVISEVGAIARASGEDLRKLEQAALDLGASTAFSASEVAAGQKYLAMAGFNTNQIIGAMPGLLDLAASGNLDLARASDIASDVLTQFGLKAEQMGYLADVMAKTFTTSNTNLELLGDTMKYVGPVANAAGVALHETAAMAGFMANQGVKGSMAGTALRAMLSRLQAPSNEAAKVIRQLGLQTQDAAGNMLPIFDILEQLESTMSGMGTAEKAATMKKIFGEEAVTGVTALLSQGTDALRQYAATLDDSGGTASKVAKEMLNNFNGAVKILKSAWEGLQITVGKVFLPVLTQVTKTVTGVISKLNDLANTRVGKVLIGVTGAVAAAVVVVTALSAGAAALAIVFPFITAALGSIVAALAALAWPFTLIIGILALFSLAWKNNLGGIRTLVMDFWDKIKLVATGVWQLVTSMTGSIGYLDKATAKELEAKGLYGIVRTLAAVYYAVKQFITGLIDGFKPLGAILTAELEPAFTMVAGALRSLAGYLGLAATKTAAANGAIDGPKWREYGEIVAHVVGTALVAVVQVLSAVIKTFIFLGTIIGESVAWWTLLYENISSKAVAGFNFLIQTISNVIAWFRSLGQAVTGGVTNAFTTAANFIQNFDLVGAAKATVEKAISFLRNIDLGAVGEKIMDTLAAGIQRAAAKVKETLKNALGSLKKLLPHSDAEEGPLSTLTASGMALIGTIAQGVMGGADTLKKATAGALAGLTLAVPSVAAVMPPGETTPLHQQVAEAGSPGQSGRATVESRGRTIIIQNLTVTLPDVKDADGFAEQLQRFVDQYDA